MKTFKYALILVSLYFTSAHAGYDCLATLGQSRGGDEAQVAQITEFKRNEYGALVGRVVIGEYRFTAYEFENNRGMMFLSIELAQTDPHMTPYLPKVTADTLVPGKGQNVSVSLEGIGYLTCTGK